MKAVAMFAALLTAWCISCVALADESAPAAYATCVACHGAVGEGNAALNAPALAGQQAAYLERQLQPFQVRGARSRSKRHTWDADARNGYSA